MTPMARCIGQDRLLTELRLLRAKLGTVLEVIECTTLSPETIERIQELTEIIGAEANHAATLVNDQSKM